jgi:mannose-1-phosphate guanylyltransferase
MLPVAGLPVTEHQLMAAQQAGITSIVLAASYLSDVFIPYFGDGSKWGINLQYAVEKAPLGTGGAIRNAARLLTGEESIAIFNGDVLSSHDLERQIRQHEERDADVTLLLTRASDARPYGCVPVDEDGRVLAFLEKMEKPVTDTINAGCYIFHPRVLHDIPENKVVSIERETFPHLIESGRRVFGFIDGSYWLDIGTPQTLLQGSIDLVKGIADAPALNRLSADRHGGEYVAMEGAEIAPSAHISGGSAIGYRVSIADGAQINGSIISDGAVISQGVSLDHCFVAAGAEVEMAATFNYSYIGTDGVLAL